GSACPASPGTSQRWSRCRSSTPRRRSPSDGWTPPPGHRAIPDSLTTTIEQAVARVPIWRKASSLTASPISGGITNVNYRVEVDGEAFVVRIEGQGTERLGIDRQREYQCLVAASRTGVGPEVVYCLPAGGILVTRLIDGRNLSAEVMGWPEMIAGVVRPLALYHMGLPFGAVTDLSLAQLKLLKIIAELREGMWCMVGVGVSNADFDFLGYATTHFDRYHQAVDDARVSRWMVQAAAGA